ncbi:MAG TPA: hypothetical protein VL171_11080 [Verrucomicrobiae bacterium]|nr:hypothetical protein [Verrucomicrobiae bacterium]
MMTVEVTLPETDQASLRFLVEKGGADFFSRETVMRTRSEGHLRPPPYSVIKEFIKAFPDSSINFLIFQRAEFARQLDVSAGPNHYLAQDQEQLAEIIALTHPSLVQELKSQRSAIEKQLMATTDPYQKQLLQRNIDGFDRWIALIEKYTR